MKHIQILGTGCRKCAQLQTQAEEAVKHLGIQATVEKVEDIAKITEFGVFMTPALVVDGEVKVQGHIPPVREIEKMLAREAE